MAHQSILDAIIEERLRFIKTAPERLKALEKMLESGKLKPAKIRALHEEIEKLRKAIGNKR